MMSDQQADLMETKKRNADGEIEVVEQLEKLKKLERLKPLIGENIKVCTHASNQF